MLDSNEVEFQKLSNLETSTGKNSRSKFCSIGTLLSGFLVIAGKIQNWPFLVFNNRDLVTTGIIWVATGSNTADEATTSSPITPTQQMKNFGPAENSEKCDKLASNRLSPEHNDCESRDSDIATAKLPNGAKDEIYSSQCRGCSMHGDLTVGTDSEMGKLQRNMTIIKALPDDSECTHTVKNIVNNVTVGITCYRDG